LLRHLRYSQQKPIQKATQRDEAAIEAWKEQRWDELKKRPKRKGGPLFSWMRLVFTCYRWRCTPMPQWARRLFWKSN
jgi:hypothetical protein